MTTLFYSQKTIRKDVVQSEGKTLEYKRKMRKMRERILVISLVLIFPMGGVAVLIPSWASPMPTSDRILPTVVGVIGLSVLPVCLCLWRSLHNRIN